MAPPVYLLKNKIKIFDLNYVLWSKITRIEIKKPLSFKEIWNNKSIWCGQINCFSKWN